MLARHAARVIGIEIVPDAIRDAKENARLNGVENAQFYCGAAESILPELVRQGLRPDVIVLDPMLATGGSAIDAITIVKRSHPKSIKFLCVIAAPEGLEALTAVHPDVQVYCAAVDEKLNENGYILPGLGDAGDRIFGTI